MNAKCISILAILVISLASTFADSIIVPGTADPWLAGTTNGATDSGDTAPAESAVLATSVALLPGMILTFTNSGAVSRDPDTNSYPLQPPDGNPTLTTHRGAFNGIADLKAPFESLIGVFLGPDQPDLTAEPGGLDFGSTNSRNALVIQPRLKQAFFIGDGVSTNGLAQSFVVPAGCTRLYLGTMDAYGGAWYNNVGQFSVQIQASTLLAIRNVAGQAAISVYGSVGSTNIIQYTTNLDNPAWLTITNVVLSNPPRLLIDTTSPITGQRYYRAVRDQ